jgi:uncharacterized membrane protein YheB (UPF0754 family)
MLQWILPTLAGAFIGWGTNWLALKMLFHPRRPWGIGKLRFQGVLPKRKFEIAARMGEMAEEELVSGGDIGHAFGDPAVLEGFRIAARAQARVFAQERLPGIHPLAGLLLTRGMKDKAEEILSRELCAMVPGLARSIGEGLESNLPIKDLVQSRLQGISLEDLEALLHEVLDRSSTLARWSGAILGALVGFAQAALLALMR